MKNKKIHLHSVLSLKDLEIRLNFSQMIKMICLNWEIYFNLNSIKEDFMNFLNLLKKLEKGTSPRFILLLNIKIKRNMLLKHSQKKEPINKKMVKSLWSIKFKLTENLLIKILWDFMVYMNHKILSMFKLNFFKEGSYMIRFKPNINSHQNKSRLSLKVYVKVFNICMQEKSCIEIWNLKILF